METSRTIMLLLLLIAFVRFCCTGHGQELEQSTAERSFRLANDTFWKDGKPFVIRSGSLHYFRIPQLYWRDRIQRMKALGLNSITTYAAWNYHETEEGQFERLDELSNFLDVANEEGMLVYMRLGPYMCGEWEFGGLPSYLLMKPNIKLRTFNAAYLEAVDRWWTQLLPRVQPHLYKFGGPIILAQVENEFGSYGNCAKNPDDARYMNHLLDMLETHLGKDVLYTTVDGGEDKEAALLSAGSPWKGDPRVLATVDGPLSVAGYAEAFQRQKDFNAPGHAAKMWAELWVGWFTPWQSEFAANKSAKEAHEGMTAMVATGASFSLYMAHGGTNFGFWSGANGKIDVEGWEAYEPDITSYDYNAPISEAGDHNIGADGGDLFVALSSAIATKYGQPAAEPAPIPKVSYGSATLSQHAALFENLETMASCRALVGPGMEFPSMEALGQAYGLLLYETAASFDAFAMNFTSKIVHDRVQVFVGGVEVGAAYRAQCPATVAVPAGQSLQFLIENMGRVNYGPGLYDYKGLHMVAPTTGPWSASCIDLHLDRIANLSWKDDGTAARPVGPLFLKGSFQVAVGDVADTFLDTMGLTKGHAWVNGHHLGRYWETAGPQHTLYVPGPFLVEGYNEVVIFDLHGTPVHTVTFVEQPRYPTRPDDTSVVII